jgi:CRP-like cAMP-binding protein
MALDVQRGPAGDRPQASPADRAWQASFLSELPQRVQDDLGAAAFPMTVPVGNVIYRPLDEACLLLVVGGLVRVTASSPAGRRAAVRYARAGDCVGIMSVVFDDQDVTVEAVTRADLRVLSVNKFRQYARTEPEVGWLLARVVGRVANEGFDMMSAIIFHSVRERLARHLLDLAVRREDQLVVTEDQQEMADAIGSVREVVSRTLRDFRERGLVSRNQVGTRLDDADGLYKISLGE